MVVYVDLFLADIFLDDLLILDDVLTDPQLLLDHRPLLGYDFFLDHWNADLVVADLCSGALLVHRYPLDADLLMLCGHPHLLAISAYALAHVQGPSLALSGAGLELLLASLHPKLVLVLEVVAGLVETLLLAAVAAELASLGVAHPHAGPHLAGMLSVRVTVMRSVRPSILGGLRAL